MKGNKCEEREEACKGMQHDENKEDAVVENDISVAFSFFFFLPQLLSSLSQLVHWWQWCSSKLRHALLHFTFI